MGKKIIYERYLWFHKEIEKGRHPNAPKFADRFGISIKTNLKGFLNHALNLYTLSKSISLYDLNEKVSVKNIEYAQTDELVFHRVLDALINAAALKIEYFSPHNDETTTREIKREILKYGSQVEVLSPQALREEVKEEIEKMNELYK